MPEDVNLQPLDPEVLMSQIVDLTKTNEMLKQQLQTEIQKAKQLEEFRQKAIQFEDMYNKTQQFVENTRQEKESILQKNNELALLNTDLTNKCREIKGLYNGQSQKVEELKKLLQDQDDYIKMNYNVANAIQQPSFNYHQQNIQPQQVNQGDPTPQVVVGNTRSGVIPVQRGISTKRRI